MPMQFIIKSYTRHLNHLYPIYIYIQEVNFFFHLHVGVYEIQSSESGS